MQIPFRHKTLLGMTIPWGDVASAYYSTGIPNIEVYTATPPKQVARLRRLRFLLPILAFKPLQRLVKWQIGRSVTGPGDQELATGTSSLWGRVSDDQGRSVAATLETLSGYRLTALTAVAALQRAWLAPCHAASRRLLRHLAGNSSWNFPRPTSSGRNRRRETKTPTRQARRRGW